MKKLFLILALALMCYSCRKSASDLPDLRESYGNNDTRPFGAAIAFRLLQYTYPDLSIWEQKKSFQESINWYNDKHALYISVSKKLFMTPADVKILRNYAIAGNTVVLAAAEIDTSFLDKLGLGMRSLQIENFGPAAYAQAAVSDRPIPDPVISYKYYYYPFINYFDRYDSATSFPISYNSIRKPNGMRIILGEGQFIIFSDPRIFSNYFLLTRGNHSYLVNLFRHLPDSPDKIYWNEYFLKNSNSSDDFSSLAAIMKYPALRWAFWVVVGLGLIYIFFNGKRRQRIIPVRKPVENSSVAYAEAIAGLYLKQHDNRIIALKMGTWFREYLRNHYFIQHTVINESYIDSLSRKTGVSPVVVKDLYDILATSQSGDQISNATLLTLNSHIQQFYKSTPHGRKHIPGNRAGAGA
jgi:hypothetical protein